MRGYKLRLGGSIDEDWHIDYRMCMLLGLTNEINVEGIEEVKEFSL